MDNLTTCQIIQASERASDLRKNFICSQDSMHQAMLKPLADFALCCICPIYYVFGATCRECAASHP